MIHTYIYIWFSAWWLFVSQFFCRVEIRCLLLWLVSHKPFTQGCDLCATFERPENWAGRSVVTHTQKVLFLCNCCSTSRVRSLYHQNCCCGKTGRTKEADWRQNCCHGGLRVSVVAEWRHNGRHSDRSKDAIGRAKEAQWWYKEGRSKLLHSVYTSTHFFLMQRPMADPCASILRPQRCVCLPHASFGRPVSDRPPPLPLCDCYEYD